MPQSMFLQQQSLYCNVAERMGTIFGTTYFSRESKFVALLLEEKKLKYLKKNTWLFYCLVSFLLKNNSLIIHLLFFILLTPVFSDSTLTPREIQERMHLTSTYLCH